MTDRNLSLARLRDVLSYDPDTGVFRWVKSTSNRAPAGAVAGAANGSGYLRISIDGSTYYAHRLAWMWVHGAMPEDQIDHKDGDRSNNRAANLRAATHRENGQNQPLRRTNTSGFHGVSWSKAHGKFAAYIMANGKKRHLGLFDDAPAASRAYLAAKQHAHPFQPVPRDAAA